MPKNANPARVAICRDYGAEAVLVDDVHQAFDEVARIARSRLAALLESRAAEPQVGAVTWRPT